jgi:hypothetical protein
MSSNLHPDLVLLRQRYDELLAYVDAGHLTAENAISTLATLTAVDSLGAEWRISADGTFLRNMPGAPAVPADPRQFHSIGTRPGAAMNPAALAQPPLDPYRAPVAPGAGSVAPGYQTNAPAEPRRERRERTKPSLPALRIPAAVTQRRRPILVLVGCIAAVAIIISRSSGGAPAEPVVAPQSEQFPSEQQAADVVDALTGGRDAATSVLATGSVDELLAVAGNLAAAEALGLDVRAGELSIDGEAVSVDVDVYDGDTLVAAWSLPLTRDGERWIAAGPVTARN